MRISNLRYLLVVAFLFPLLAASCGDKDDPINRVVVEEPEEGVEVTTEMLVDLFAIGALENYYLWSNEDGRDELVERVLNPLTCTDPINQFKKALHKDDRWSYLSDDYDAMLNSSKGVEVTDGIYVTPYIYGDDNDEVLFLVNFVYPGGPGEKAGVKRGDIFTQYNGSHMSTKTYKRYFDNEKQFTFGYGAIDTLNASIIDTDKSVTLTPVEMYEEPVIAYKVFDTGEKKVGYFCYTSFVDNIDKMKEAFELFTSQGVSEMILDLRYNTGGLVPPSVALGSMLAPVSVVESEEILSKNVFNDAVSQIYTSMITVRFDKSYVAYNPDVKKIYVLTGANTASASEMVTTGLMPYTEIVTIGKKTHGKFCSGIMINGKFVFHPDSWKELEPKIGNWGTYVMIGTYTNSKDENPCRPNGITPDIVLDDRAFAGIPLGDENEVLLHKALELAGMKFEEKAETRAAAPLPALEALPDERPALTIFPALGLPGKL